MADTAQKPTVRIEDWYLRQLGGQGAMRLHGTVFGHPDPMFPDGTRAITSEIVDADYVNGIVETRNSIYQLGARAPE